MNCWIELNLIVLNLDPRMIILNLSVLVMQFIKCFNMKSNLLTTIQFYLQSSSLILLYMLC